MRRAVPLAVVLLLVPVLPGSGPGPAEAAQTPVMGRPLLVADQLAAWFASTGRTHRLSGLDVATLARLFLEEGEKEGVRGDVAFAQTMFETGFLGFSGTVPPHLHNYAGIGAPNNTARFPDARTGVRAQIQHLRAYADPAVGRTGTATPLVDPRFDLVNPKGSARTFEALSGRWAPGPDYGEKVVAIFQRILDHAGPTLRDRALGAPIVGADAPGGAAGVWVADAIGGVFALGGLPFRGSVPGLRLQGARIGDARVVGIAATPDGRGYWLVDDNGGVFAFGSAKFFGSIPLLRLRGQRIGDARVVDVLAGPGGGYWLVDEAGGVFTFGPVPFRGSAADAGLDIVGAAPTSDGRGYRVVSSDGAIISYA